MPSISPISPRSPPAIPPPPARVLSLMASNDAPDAGEIHLVREYISALKRYQTLWRATHIDILPVESANIIQKHDNTINWLHERNSSSNDTYVVLMPPLADQMPHAIVQLIRERDRLEELILEHKGILSPIRRLPAELITKILRLVPPRTFGFSGYQCEYSPWRLTRISARWRTCALGDQSLWSKLSINGEIPGKFKHDFPVAMIQAQLSLSRDAPLDLHFNWSAFDKCDSDAHFLKLLNSAIDHCSRWQRLKLGGDVNLPSFITALSRIKSQIPRLRRLESLLRVTRLNTGLDGADIDFFAVAPALREVFLSKPRLDDVRNSRSVVFPIPWEQITKYCAALDGDGHSRILRRAQGLRECSLLCVDGQDDVHGTNIQLLALNKLHVQDTTFLDMLTAPGVEELIVTRRLDSVLPFLRRSEARLTSLTIIDWNPSYELIAILRYCPTLTHLCLALVPDVIPTIGTLTSILHELRDGNLCPELTSLFWKHEIGPAPLDPSTDYQETLHSMIASRRRGKLTSFRLFLRPGFEKTWVERIQTPEYEGFDVRVLELSGPIFIEAVNPP